MAESPAPATLPRRSWRRPPWRVVIPMLCVVGFALAAGAVIAWDDYHLRAARAALADYATDEAEANLDRCLGLWAGRFDRHLVAAQIALARGRYKEAEAELDACERLRNKTDEVAQERLRWGALQGKTGPAANMVRTTWGQEPARAVPLLTALAAGQLENYDAVEALATAELALEQSPTDAEALLCRGRAWDLLQKPEQALADFRQAFERAPRLPGARLRLAEALYQNGHPAEAAAHLEALRSQQPEDADVLLALARCRHDLAEPDAAARLYEELLSRYPDHSAGLLEAAALALRRRRPAEAEASLRRAIARTPDHLEAHVRLRACLLAAGKKEEADAEAVPIEAIERTTAHVRGLLEAAQAAPPAPQTCREIGLTLLRLGRDDEALPWLFLAVRITPDDRAVRAALAEHFRRVGQPERARRHD
jgi:tetratricopeptide (TPR) repeat protein